MQFTRNRVCGTGGQTNDSSASSVRAADGMSAATGLPITLLIRKKIHPTLGVRPSDIA